LRHYYQTLPRVVLAGFFEHFVNFLSENEVNSLVSTGTVNVAARDRRAGEVTTRVF